MKNPATKIVLMVVGMAFAGIGGAGCVGEPSDDLELPEWVRRAMSTSRTQEETPEAEPGPSQTPPQGQSVDNDSNPIVNVGTESVSEEVDSDGDGVLDGDDQCPHDPAKSVPGVCGCGVADVDSDGDGTLDCNDLCLNDPAKTEPGACGCGVADTDSDGNGTPDCLETGTLFETFDEYANGDDPADWMDTNANNSMTGNDSLFKVFDLGGEKVFGTSSTETNIHSHYIGAGSAAWSSYAYTGRLMITQPSGGIGLTFYSDYPNTDTYYRLRRYNSNAFHIAPHGASVTGTTDTGVVPAVNTWYHFRIEVEDVGPQTAIRAKVWAEGSAEPADWQVDCYDASLNRLTAGTIGLWSHNSGSKYWDDLRVTGLSCDVDSDGDGVSDCNDQCPSDSAKSAPGACGCGTPDTDSDGDSVPDCNDQCPGVPDADSDGDGVADCDDVCPGFDDSIDSDGDGTPDGCESATLCVNPSILDFGCTATSRTFEVWNCGSGTLNYSVGDNAAWLQVSSSGGGSAGEHDTITATVNRAGLADGDYSAEITVSSTNITPQMVFTISVALTAGCPDAQSMQTASRTSGVAPLAVFFDAVEPASGVVQPTDGLYSAFYHRWDFGDDPAATWSTDGKSKNTASGFVAAHVFERPGSYVVTLKVTDASGNTHNYHQTVTVADPDVAFEPPNGTTYYVSSSGGSDSNTGLKDANGVIRPFRTFAYAMSRAATHTRILFKRGDSWTISSGSTISANGPGLIGAYGNGDKPHITVTSSATPFVVNASDWRVMDFHVSGSYVWGQPSGGGLVGGGRGAHVLFMNNDSHNTGDMAYWIESGTHLRFIAGCEMYDVRKYGIFASYGSTRCAALGNHVEHSYGEHCIRAYTSKLVVADNYLALPAPTKTCLALKSGTRSSGQGDSQFQAATRNTTVFDGTHISTAPENSEADQYLYHVLIEGHTFLPPPGADRLRTGIQIATFDIAVRNNVSVGTDAFIRLGGGAISPQADVVRIYNNSLCNITYRYFNAVVGGADTHRIEFKNNAIYSTANAEATILEYRNDHSNLDTCNNLFWLPGSSAGRVFAAMVNGVRVAHTLSEWRSRGHGAGTMQADPLFQDMANGNLKLRANSPGIDAGCNLASRGVICDFEGASRPQAQGYDIGAYER